MMERREILEIGNGQAIFEKWIEAVLISNGVNKSKEKKVGVTPNASRLTLYRSKLVLCARLSALCVGT